MPPYETLHNEELVRLYAELANLNPLSEDYATIVTQLGHLKTLNTYISTRQQMFIQLSTTISSLIGIGLILQHEQLHIIATKALRFVRFK